MGKDEKALHRLWREKRGEVAALDLSGVLIVQLGLVTEELNRRFDEPFWDRCRDMNPPPSLGRKIELFSLCGQISQYDDETFEEQNWAALLIGAGIIPERYDPRTDTIPDDAQIAKVQQRLRDVASAVADMPPMNEFLEVARGSMEAAV